jgi:hypothetical protein
MFNPAEIKEFAAQKQLLVAESELNRHAVRNEFARLQSAASDLSGILRPGRSSMMLLAPLAGFVMSSGGARWKGWARKLVVCWQLFRVGKRLLGALASRQDPAEPGNPRPS